MLIKGNLREVNTETFLKKDKTTGSRVVLSVEVAQPLEIMRIELGNDHGGQEGRYKSLVGKDVLIPAQHVLSEFDGNKRYNWRTTGNGAPLALAPNSAQAAA